MILTYSKTETFLKIQSKHEEGNDKSLLQNKVLTVFKKKVSEKKKGRVEEVEK